MSDNAGVVTDWLRSKPGHHYCQKCITENTGVRPPNQMNQIVPPLGQAAKEWRSSHTLCDGCRQERKCIAFVGA